MAVPLHYGMRNLLVRRASSLFTALGIAMTVAVLAGVLALREGFEQLYKERGRQDVAVYLRPGASSEGESGISRERASILIKERPEIARNERGEPLAAAETFLSVYLEQVIGGKTNVPLRGIQPKTLEIHETAGLRLVEGRWLEFGADEVVVGEPLAERMLDCRVGDTLVLNTTPFRVVGVFACDGPEGGEVWGDVERMMEALQRPMFQRVIAKVVAGTDFAALAAELEDDPRVPSKVQSEKEYLAAQTGLLSGLLGALAFGLTVIMSIAAVLGALNTMLASVAARTHEIGVLLAIGYRRSAVFGAFVFESALIGLVGGLLGVVIVLPFDGVETGLMNWNTFTDVSFAFQVTPRLMLLAFATAFVLGVVGGAIPAARAARLDPVDAFRER